MLKVVSEATARSLHNGLRHLEIFLQNALVLSELQQIRGHASMHGASGMLELVLICFEIYSQLF